MNTILIVDDIKVNLKVLEVLLTRNGYAVLPASSAEKALSLLQEHPCHLIISDIQMPEMDGLQFCRLCKLDENLAHIPFVFYSSSHTGARTREQARKAGARAVVKKPADPARLLKIIDAILSENATRSRTNSPDDREVFFQPGKTEVDSDGSRPLIPAEKKQGFCRLPESLRGIVWTGDAGGDFRFISPAAERLTGFSERRIREMGRDGWLERVHPADAIQVRRAFMRLFEDHAALDIVYRFECRDGKIAWFHDISGIPYKDEPGDRYQADGLTTDVSAWMLAQMQQMRSREQDVVSFFSKGVSHDLNNLLSGTADYIQLAARPSTTLQERERFLANALKITHSAQDLIQDISFLSEKEKPVEKNSLLPGVVTRTVLSVLEGSDIRYRFEMAGQLWPCRVDARLMARALEHVIVNAAESMARKKDGVIEVILQNMSIVSEADDTPGGDEVIPGPGRYVRITIRDNGSGIEDQVLHQVFHPYFSSKPRSVKKGVGMGLALSRAIILRHGGEMAVHSKKDHGTEMEIFLPAETG